MIKLVAVDMDGTLLAPDGRISGRNTQVIQYMQNKGVEFLVCTGRSHIDALIPLKEAGLKGAAVCMNGASIYDPGGRLIHKKELHIQQVKQILECCRGENIIFDFMTDRGSCTIASEEEFRDSFERNVLLPMAEYTYEGVRQRFHFIPREELFERGLEFFKISVIHESPEVLKRIRERLSAVPELAAASSFRTNLELTHREAQKGIALAAYASMKGIGLDETMAIGDSENDLSMLSMPLKYTVAMENAMESVKRAAKCQTRSNSRDGVAYAIENLVLGRGAGMIW